MSSTAMFTYRDSLRFRRFVSCSFISIRSASDSKNAACRLILLPIVRSFAASADICEVDAQGRILIKTGLREYAGLTKDVVFAGTLNHIEVWDKAQWEQENSMDDMDDIAEKLADLGLSV